VLTPARAVILFALLTTSCGVKRTVTVPKPLRAAQAQTASLNELLKALETYSERISSLSSSAMKVTFTSGKVESGELQEYRAAPGYVLLKRPDAIRLNVQNPLTKTALIELVSLGEQFHVWFPRDNKFYTGENGTAELEVEGGPTFSARPAHIFEAILPQKIALEDPAVRVAMVEDRDEVTKYYVLSIYRQTAGQVLEPLRRLWIDRADLTVSRQLVYGKNGAVVSMIDYSNQTKVDGLYLPMSIRIERPGDGYILELQFKSWRLNPELPEKAFVLNPPPGAQRVLLKEKV
jgi:outer membrane lipoprotein-sorting protein